MLKLLCFITIVDINAQEEDFYQPEIFYNYGYDYDGGDVEDLARTLQAKR